MSGAVCVNNLLFVVFVLVEYSHMWPKMHEVCEARRNSVRFACLLLSYIASKD